MSASMNTIVILGGTSGIGEAFAKRFHQKGKNVIVTGRRSERLAEMEKAMPGLKTYTMNMGDVSAVTKNVETLFSKFPNIDTVWVNGGLQYSSSIKDFSSTTDEKVLEEINVNFTAPMILGRHIIPRLLQQKGETNFMITSSGLGFVPGGSLFPIYCPTKAAIHMYLVGIRQALKDTNVNVLELVPPYVDGTELGLEHRDKFAGATPLPMQELVDTSFKIMEETPAKDIREIAAGTAVPRVEAWRSKVGELTGGA